MPLACCCCADEGKVQDARSKAAAAGVPSSEPMTLQELEAVQDQMVSKLKQAEAFTAGEQFLPLAEANSHAPVDDGRSQDGQHTYSG